jgi:hypothetical protein
MATTKNVHKETYELCEEVMRWFRMTLPSKQFQAEMMLGLVSLHMQVRKIVQTGDLAERRSLLSIFSKNKMIIENALALLKQSPYRRLDPLIRARSPKSHPHPDKNQESVHFKQAG